MISSETKHSLLGMIPFEWKIKNLSTLATISYGISDPLDKNLKTGIPIIGMSNITKDGLFKWEDRFYVNPTIVKDRDILYPFDILFNWRNGSADHLGKTVLFNLNGKYTHVGFLLRIRCDRELLPPYCDLYIKGIKMRGYFLKAKMQVNNTFNKEELSGLPIVLPPYAEQKKIAEILGVWDAGIEKLERLIAAKRKLKKGLMQQLLTGKKRFKEFKGEKWKHLTLDEICNRFVNGGTPSTQIQEYWNGHIPWITGADFYENRLGIIRRKITEESVKNSSTNIIHKGNLLVVTRTGVGKLAIAPFDVAISQDITGLYLDNNKCDIHFLYHYLSFSFLGFAKYNQGTSINGVTRNDLKNHTIFLPVIKEQKAIASVLDTYDQEINLLIKKLEALKQQKKGLMQKLLTGKIRVKV